MAKVQYGITGPFIGRVGNVIGYMLNGVNVIKQVPSHHPPKTPKQLANQQRMGLISALSTSIEDFLRFSFRSVATPDKLGPRNYAISKNKEQAVKGVYPNQQTDFTKLIVAAGNIPAPKKPEMKLNGNQLEFSWEADMETAGTDKRDQVMLLAYFPESYKSICLTSGARRTVEKELLRLPAFNGETVVETYMAFVADDRNDASPSVYMGRVVLNAGTGTVEEPVQDRAEMMTLVDTETGEILQDQVQEGSADPWDGMDMNPAQRDRMAEISRFLANFKEEINVGYKSSDGRYSPFNKAISHNITAAFHGQPYSYFIDFPKLVFSKGKRESAWATRLSAEPGKMLKVSWEVPETVNMKVIGEDDVYLILYNENQQKGISNTPKVKRQDFSATLKLYGARDGDRVFAWIFFVSADGKISSNSDYLGSVKVLE